MQFSLDTDQTSHICYRHAMGNLFEIQFRTTFPCMPVANIASLAVAMEICFFALICINSAWVNESYQIYVVESRRPDKLLHKISAKSEHICSSYNILKISKFYIQFLAPIIKIWRSQAQQDYTYNLSASKGQSFCVGL